MKSKEDMEER